MTDNMRVMLCNPSFPRKLKGAPLSLLYLASSLKHPSSGFRGEVCLLDLNVSDEPERDFTRALADFRPTHFGITRFTPNASESGKLLSRVKMNDPDVVTISGGAHEAAHGTDTAGEMKGAIDHVVTDSDGVRAFLGILGMDSKLRSMELIPDYDLVLQNRGEYQFDGVFTRPMMQMLTSTGCNRGCSFCSGKKLDLAGMETVMLNIERILSLGFGAIQFDDGNFINDRERTLELAGRIRASGLDFEWGCQTRADGLDTELLDAMRGSGCTYVCTALESADPRVLKAINKRLEPSDVSRAVGLIKGTGMKVGLYVMFGHPVELRHPEIAAATLDMVEVLRPDFVSFSMFAHYRGLFPVEEVSREKEWLYFDEGWGARHDVPLEYAIGVKEMIEERMKRKPELWETIRRF